MMLRHFLAILVLAYHRYHGVDGRRILSSSNAHGYTREVNLEALNATSTMPMDPMGERRKLAATGTAVPTTVDGHKVKNLPGLKSSVKISHYAGHLTVDEEKGGNLFYWLIEAEGIDPSTAPLLVWLNGGPGCSSMDGLFLELGPFRLDGDKLDQIKINPGSWHYAANLLFVDQPVGTGLSFTRSNDGYAGSDAAVNTHFYAFLEQFFKLHDRYTTVVNGKRKSRAFFISGESHAGHYIPCIAAHILKKNIEAGASTDPNALHVDLKGIALGNPWTDPYNQYDVSDFAHGHGLVTIGQRNRLKEKNRECRALLREGKYNQKVCFDLLDDVIDSSSLSGSHKVLMYDSRRFVHSTGVFPPGHEAVEKFLNRADVKVAIHATATPQPYVECADPPFLALSHQDGKGVVPELVEALNGGVRLLLYSGQYDIICNHVGSERVLQELPWSGREEYLKSQPGVWMVDRQPAGYIKAYKNLQSLLVLNAGHMVPMDVPKIALDMITRFLGDKDFSAGNALVGVSLINPEDIRCDNSGPRPAKRGGGTATGMIKKGMYSALGVLGYNMSSDSRQRSLQRSHRLLRQPIQQQHQQSVSTFTMANSSSNITIEAISDLCVEEGSRGDDSPCSAALLFTLGPLTAQSHPWSDPSVFDGYERVLRDLLLQDIKSAMSALTSSDLDVSVAGLEPVFSEEESWTGAGGASLRIVALRGFANIRGRRNDTAHAVGVLMGQSATKDSVLRRGLLTTVLQQPVEVVATRRLPHHKEGHPASIHPARTTTTIDDAPVFGPITASILDYASEIYYVISIMARYNFVFMGLVLGLIAAGFFYSNGRGSSSSRKLPHALQR